MLGYIRETIRREKSIYKERHRKNDLKIPKEKDKDEKCYFAARLARKLNISLPELKLQLFRYYWDEQLSLRAIASKMDSYRNAIRQAMTELGICIRTHKEAALLERRTRKKSEFSLMVQNLAERMDVTPFEVKSKLSILYWEEKHGMKTIGKMYRVSRTIIHRVMKELEIPNRSQQEAVRLHFAKSLPLPNLLYQMIIGMILGDGHLSRRAVTARLAMTISFKTLEFFELMLLPIFGQYGYTLTYYNKLSVSPPPHTFTECIYFQSPSSVELFQLHGQFYRPPTPEEAKTNPGRKWYRIIPRTLVLTPVICLLWYLGDGGFRNRPSEGCKSFNIAISTNSFSREDNEFLIQRLVTVLKIPYTEFYIDERNRIVFSVLASRLFFEYIGRCPV